MLLPNRTIIVSESFLCAPTWSCTSLQVFCMESSVYRSMQSQTLASKSLLVSLAVASYPSSRSWQPCALCSCIYSSWPILPSNMIARLSCIFLISRLSIFYFCRRTSAEFGFYSLASRSYSDSSSSQPICSFILVKSVSSYTLLLSPSIISFMA